MIKLNSLEFDFANNTGDHNYIAEMSKTNCENQILNRIILAALRENNNEAGLTEFMECLGTDMQKLIQYLCQIRLKGTKNTSELFREDREDTWLIRLFLHNNGRLYIKFLLKDMIEKITLMPDAFEISSDKIIHKFYMKANVVNIIQICAEIIDMLFKSLFLMPEEVSTMFETISRETKEKFPEAKNNSFLVLFFLRFICPTIISKSSKLNMRALTLISKIFQNVVNGIKLDENDFDNPHIHLLNEFIEENTIKINDFANMMCDRKQFSIYKKKSEIFFQESKSDLYQIITNSPKFIDKTSPEKRFSLLLYQDIESVQQKFDDMKLEESQEKSDVKTLIDRLSRMKMYTESSFDKNVYFQEVLKKKKKSIFKLIVSNEK
eukprot:TRINITY_DN8640_c0_g1_i2.p1 TRINITY_DN8640_c0_g1~~TRINITY_DN8640_c0_g1_i2.p1  ORF type:complete len:379 (+),score=100.49 TRINITY_DN8640_c0_g1_i2:307-1443(+)